MVDVMKTGVIDMTEELDMVSGVIYHNVPRPKDKQLISQLWPDIKDGDSVAVDTQRKASVYVSSFKWFQKKNPRFETFKVSTKKRKDGRVQIFFEDTKRSPREKLLARKMMTQSQ
jgi:uncharacterized HAD superfamily protein